jgi:hypothetical protein
MWEVCNWTRAIYGLIAGGVLGKKNYGGLGVGVWESGVINGKSFFSNPAGVSQQKKHNIYL